MITDYLSLDEIIYITRFLNLKNTFHFIKSLKWNLNHSLQKSILIKNKKLMVVENIYNSYFDDKSKNSDVLKELLEFFHNDIDVEDLICFMANIYPNSPCLRDTILFDLLKLYNLTKVDWNLIKVHFKFRKTELKRIVQTTIS
jgi:hypothetical protein